jgi:hypothetical protein
LDSITLRAEASARTLKPMTVAFDVAAQRGVGLGDAAHARTDDVDADLRRSTGR